MDNNESERPFHFSGPLASTIGEWADRLLAPYFASYPAAINNGDKQIHDPVAEVIDIHPWEVYVLDSPLVQRLRYVRQLGVGHVLFPTSGYSRFEHSVGVLQTATRMFRAVVDAQLASGRPIYTPEEFTWRLRIVRLAALLHDAGHCVFSHVSESFYARFSDVKTARQHFSDYFGNGVSASEAITLILLQSNAFAELLRRSNASRAIGKDDANIIELMCACIAGSTTKTSPDTFLAAIVNGSVDADKLDYLVRDAHMAGVPVSLDISRLFSKLRLAEDTTETDEKIIALAIVPSGTRALDELLVSRIFLYDKFYYHPKVMAAEEVIRRALLYLSRAVPAFASPVTLLQYGDDEFLSLTPESIATKYGIDADNNDLRRGCDLLRRVKYRELPKRAFAFALRYTPTPPPIALRFESENGVVPTDDSATNTSLQFRQIARALSSAEGRERYANNIAARARELGAGDDVYVAFQQAKRAANAAYLHVVLPNGKLEKRPTFLFKSHEWTEAYALNKATSYVFAYNHLAKVHLAAEREFAELHEGITFAPNCWIMAKVDGDDVDRERVKLVDEWLPHRLAPNILTTPRYAQRIRQQRERFASFLNSLLPNDGTHLVEAWLSQFPDADLRDSALCLLEHLTYVEPADMRAAVQKHIERAPDLQNAIWMPITKRGEHVKSAHQLMINLRTLGLKFSPLHDLTAEKIKAAGQMVFVDDSLNAGVQVSCLLLSWFGNTADCLHASDADPTGRLPDDVIEALRSVPVSFCYFSTHPLGEERLRATCASIGLRIGGIYKWADAAEPRLNLDGLRCASPASRKRLIKFLQQQGELLLTPKMEAGKGGWSQDRVQASALGYSGLGLTLAYPHSISASAPVALWEMADGPDDYWIPLFPRKPDRLTDRLNARPLGTGKALGDEQLEEYEGA